jgi:cytochrome c
MPDTMTFTKVGGALCGSLLVFMLTAWAGAALFYTGGGHGGEHEAQAYMIDTGEAEAPAAGASEAPAFEELLASADAGAGEKVFSKCKACHKVDGTDGTGPHLNGVVGRSKAAVPGFGYSEAIKAVSDQSWTPENLNGFLENPKGDRAGECSSEASTKPAFG